jgi:hypothetical protein
LGGWARDKQLLTIKSQLVNKMLTQGLGKDQWWVLVNAVMNGKEFLD